MKKKIKLSVRIKDYLIQSVLLAFSVLLALVLNEWRQNIKTNDVINRVKTSIKNEIEHNQAQVAAAYDYHQVLISDLLKDSHVIDSIPVHDLGVNFEASEKIVQAELYAAMVKMGDIPDDFELVKIDDKHIKVKLNGLNLTIRIVNDYAVFYGISNIQLRPADIFNTSWQTAQATNSLVLLDYKVVDVFADIYRKQEQYTRLSEKIVDMLYAGHEGLIPALQDLRNKEKYLIAKYEELQELLKGE